MVDLISIFAIWSCIGIGTVLPSETAMKQPSHLPRVLLTCNTGIAILYCFFGGLIFMIIWLVNSFSVTPE